MLDWTDTIVAPATSAGAGARGIVRLSGPKAPSLVHSMLVHSKSVDRPLPWKKRGVFAGTLELPSWHRQLDVLVYTWPDGRSSTGQPVVEIHLPASPVLLEGVAEALILAGARRARPGEFTLRGFLAGRIDLVQAEGVLGLIEAEDIEILKYAIDQRSGGLSRLLARLRDDLMDLLADMEAGLDFAEEDIQFVTDEEVARRLKSASEQIDDLLKSLAGREVSRHVPSVTLIGPPNAGKSSLFNALLSQARAIVSPHEGTTRDTVTALLRIGEIEVELIDTAGFESSHDGLWTEAREQRDRARRHAVLTVQCLSVKDTSTHWPQAAATVLRVRTKSDLDPGRTDSAADSYVSIHDAASIDELRAFIGRLVSVRVSFSTPVSARMRESLAIAGKALADVRESHVASAGQEIVAHGIRGVIDVLGEVLGAVYTDDLLDRVFSRFCVGK